jgi:MOSC domain-containing protein YiiM
MQIRIDALLTGKVDPDFAPERGSSAIAKRPIESRLAVKWLGISGDEQADLSVHGGVDKAIHHYSRDHYADWRDELGDVRQLGGAGAFGENVSTHGWTEADVCLGDRFRMGTALVEVAQGRQPCWKQAHFLGVPDLVARMVATGRTGWYYRVIEEGEVAAGDLLTLVDRPLSHWPVARLFTLLIGGGHRGERIALRELARSEVLAVEWRRRASYFGG